MLTLLLCLYGGWIIPLLFGARMLCQPADGASPESALLEDAPPRRCGIRVKDMMVLVLLMSADCAATMALCPATTASVLLFGDMVVILVPVVVGSFVAISVVQNAALTAVLAFLVLRVVGPIF